MIYQATVLFPGLFALQGWGVQEIFLNRQNSFLKGTALRALFHDLVRVGRLQGQVLFVPSSDRCFYSGSGGTRSASSSPVVHAMVNASSAVLEGFALAPHMDRNAKHPTATKMRIYTSAKFDRDLRWSESSIAANQKNQGRKNRPRSGGRRGRSFNKSQFTIR